MTETPNDPNQPPAPPYSAPSAYPAPPTYPTPPAGPTPPAQPPMVPSAPTYASPQAYPIPVPPPAATHPGGYPTSVMPAPAYAGYPTGTYPAAPPAPVRRTSAWTWVLLGLSIVLLLAAGGLTYGYYVAYTEVEDRNRRIGELQTTVAEREGELEQLREDLAAVEEQLSDAQACVDAMAEFVDLPPGLTEDEVNRAIDRMFDICGF